MVDRGKRRWAAGIAVACVVAVAIGGWLVLARGSSTPPAGQAMLGVKVHDTSGGAEVLSVTPGSPAAEAAIRPAVPKNKQRGDMIVGVDATAVGSAEDLVRAIAAHHPGDTVLITYVRDSATTWARLKLAVKPPGAG